MVLVLAALALLPAHPALAQRVVGTIDRLIGSARLEGEGRASLIVSVGDRVSEGQSIVTDAGSSVLVRMVDDAVLVVRPGSRIRVDEYRQAPSGTADALMSFLRGDSTWRELVGREGRAAAQASVVTVITGALRSVTGAIGRRSPGSVRINTTTVTIGIRGTDLEVLILDQGRGDDAPGTYMRVNSGAAFIENPQSERIDIEAGRVGFAPVEGRTRSVRPDGSVVEVQPLFLLERTPASFQPGELDGVIGAR